MTVRTYATDEEFAASRARLAARLQQQYGRQWTEADAADLFSRAQPQQLRLPIARRAGEGRRSGPSRPKIQNLTPEQRRHAERRALIRLAARRIKAIDEIIDQLTATERIILDYLIGRAERSTGGAFVATVAQIVAACRVSESAFHQARRKLSRLGVLWVRGEKIRPDFNRPNAWLFPCLRLGVQKTEPLGVSSNQTTQLHSPPPTFAARSRKDACRAAPKGARAERPARQTEPRSPRRRWTGPAVPRKQFVALGLRFLSIIDPTAAQVALEADDRAEAIQVAASNLLATKIPDFTAGAWAAAVARDPERAALAVFETVTLASIKRIYNPARYLSGILWNRTTGAHPETTLQRIAEARRRSRKPGSGPLVPDANTAAPMSGNE
jgi:hypothetical protein